MSAAAPAIAHLPANVRARLEEIRDLLHRRNSNTVLPVIGAGLSSPHLPGWTQLLQELIADASQEHRGALANALQMGRFLDVAALLEVDARVQGAGIAERIRRHYSQPRMRRPEIYDLVAQLPVTQFATTNYDPWLKDAVSRRIDRALRVYTPADDAAWDDLGQASAPAVLMLHGDADRPSTCVLSTIGFRNLIHRNRAFHDGVRALIQGRSLLFLGHSLSDPDLVLMLEAWAAAISGSTTGAMAPRHYLLTTGIDAIERTRLLNLRVQPVEYGPTGDYSMLPAILKFLQTEPPPPLEPSRIEVATQRYADNAAPHASAAVYDRDKWKQVNEVVEAHRQLLAGDVRGAEATIARVKEQYGDAAISLAVDGMIRSRTGKFEESAAISRHVLRQFRDEIGYAEQATHEWSAGNLPEALVKSVAALSEDPSNILAWLIRGAVLMADDPQKALRNVDTALDVFLRLYHAWGLRLRAQLLLRLKQPDQALQAASAAIELATHSAFAYDTRSSILLALNRNDEALRDLDAAIRLSPSWPGPYRMKTAVMADLQRAGEAVAAATAALAVGGEDSLMYEIRASSLAQLRKYREAVADVQKARMLDPSSPTIAALSERLARLLSE